MSRLDLEVSEFIRIITYCKDKIFSSYEVVKKLVEENDNVRRSIPSLFLPLMSPIFAKLELAFQPCLSVVTWTSLKIPEVCDEIRRVIHEVGGFTKKIKDAKEARVDEVFEIISETNLINLNNDAMSPAQFSSDNLTFGVAIGEELEIKSSAAETAVIAIINKCLGLIKDPEVEEDKYLWLDPERVRRQIGSQTRMSVGDFEPGFGVIDEKVPLIRIHNNCMEVFAYFNNKLIEALVKCTKRSLEILKKRIGSSRLVNIFFYAH